MVYLSMFEVVRGEFILFLGTCSPQCICSECFMESVEPADGGERLQREGAAASGWASSWSHGGSFVLERSAEAL